MCVHECVCACVCVCVCARVCASEREPERKRVDVVYVVILKLLLCLLCSIQLWSLIFLTYAIKWQIQPAWGERKREIERKKKWACCFVSASKKPFQLLIGENEEKNDRTETSDQKKNSNFFLNEKSFFFPIFSKGTGNAAPAPATQTLFFRFRRSEKLFL